MDYSKLYEYFIVLFHLHNYNNLSKLRNKYNLDEVYSYVYKFWKEFIDQDLDLSCDEDKETLFQFLNRVFRYPMLNDLLEQVYDTITDQEKDEFFLNNFESIYEIVFDSLKQCEINKVSEENLAYLSHEDLDSLFKEFLLDIDKDGDFLKVYEELKSSKRLLYYDLLSNEDKDELTEILKKKLNKDDIKINNIFSKTEKEAFIIIDRKENISDLRTLTHEFFHYYVYSCNKNKDTYYLLLEFPSIFYEYIVSRFLLKKGYSLEDVSNLLMYRLNEFNEKSDYLSPINYYLKLYIESGKEIAKESDIERTKETIAKYIEENGEEKFKELLKENSNYGDPELLAEDHCDMANYYLNLYPEILSNNYPYIIGNFLASRCIDLLVRHEITLSEMKKITESLPDIDPKIIIDAKNNKENNNKQLQKENK